MRATQVLLLSFVLLSGCATTPNPEEICSAEWIKPRADAAMEDFRENVGEILGTLAGTSEAVEQSEGFGLVERARVLFDLARLVNTFQDGQTLRDLRTLGDTCNDPELALRAFNGVLTEYEVPQPVIQLLNELEGFRQLVAESQQP